MKVEYLFSKTPKSIVSKLISWAAKYEKLDLEKYPSHIAVLIDETLVVESTLLTGVRMMPYKTWKKKNEELFRIPCMEQERSSKEVLEKATQLYGKNYDWVGILFFAWRYLGLIIFGRPLPSKNHWQNDNRFFCCEYAATLTGENLSMKSPARVCRDWLEGAK